MAPLNVLYIISDQHQQKATGCYGHPFVTTPNIDRLAARGTRFETAYTNSAICVPARAVLATGRYVHDTGYWDNAFAYEGRVKSWHHMLHDNGLGAVSIGKLHFRTEQDPTGFEEQIVPLHIVDGVGDVRSCIKRPMAPSFKRWRGIERMGPGESTYTLYDRQIAEKTIELLKEKGANKNGKPWTLFCSFVCPHPPYCAPQEFYDLYPHDLLARPKLSEPDAPLHPWILQQERNRNYNDFVNDENRPALMANYLGCTSFMDWNVGRVLDALDEAGLRDETLVIYTTDHGEMLGTRRLWGKSNMYEESAAIPMIVAGPGIPEGKVSATAATLADIAPTVLDGVGLADVAASEPLVGQSLIGLSQAPDDPHRVAFGEYFAAAADRAAFMIRKDKYKYVRYQGYEPELFDLETDPEELNSLAADPALKPVVDDYDAILKGIVDPEAADERAYQDQCALVEKYGGREALIAKGAFQGTPAPGEKPVYVS